jgi:hypothetical protein
MARIAVLDRLLFGSLPCADANANGRWEVYGTGRDSLFAFEYAGGDSFRRVNLGTPAPGAGLAGAWEVGDGDQDGRADLILELSRSDLILESPTPWSFPSDSVWQVRIRESSYGKPKFIDLDRNGHRETAILKQDFGIWLFECRGDNRYESTAVLTDHPPYGTYTNFDTCDFDLDGHCELVTGEVIGHDNAPVWFFEATGRPDTPYVMSAVCSTGIQQIGCVATAPDMDHDGWPEVVALGFSPESTMLMVIQAVGHAQYEVVWRLLVPRQSWFPTISVGDVNGDGTDEFAWNSGSGVLIYRCTGLRQYEQVWQSDSGGWGGVRLFDINRDGRAEVIFNVVSGNSEYCEVWEDTEGLAVAEPTQTQRGSPPTVQPAIARPGAPVLFAEFEPDAAVEVFGSDGRLVRSLRLGRNVGQLTWDLRDQTGRQVPAGIYLAVIRSRNQTQQLKLCVVR